jgi:DNA-binding NtrC family response regulator
MVRLAVMCDRDTVDAACVERLVLQGSLPNGGLPTLRLEDLERRAVEDAMKRLGGDKRRAAEALGIALKTLYNKLEKYGLK